MKKNAVFHRLTALMLAAALAVGLCVSASAASFADVPSTYWAAQSISRCAELGFFKGESAANFGVGKPMTRAAFVTALCRFFGWDSAASTETPYADVSSGAWYAGAVSAAYENEAVTTQRDLFRPDDAITREEMAVMLVRALGYTTISGLSQAHPFTDVTTNAGYVAMAYDMGLVTGTTATTFSPNAAATREQAAVILMRLYDKLHAAPHAMALISEWPEEGMDLSGYEVVVLDAGRYAVAGKKPVLSRAMDAEEAAVIMAAAHEAGAKVVLYASARATILKAPAADTAALLAAAAEEWGCDGAYLEVSDVPAKSKKDLTALAAATNEALGDKLFYMGAMGPSLSDSAAGYDHTALAAAADELVVRIESPVTTSGSFTSAPAEPVEELYCALSTLKDIENVTVLLSAKATAWRGSSSLTAPTAVEIESYLVEGAQRYYSQRYASPYLRLEDGSTIWYADGESAAARLQLVKLFGAEMICVSGADDASAQFLSALELS